ncbi:MAG: Rpn family recombination-promoting nuclease/putative transposase [Chthoniobacterales bacterium]
MPRYLDPKSDLTFKKIFGNHPDLLKSFLNAVLPLPEDCLIETLSYLSPENVPRTPIAKYSIVDVRCCDNHGRQFIVEMQIDWTPDFIQRMLFNAASTYVKQLDQGKEYEELCSVYELAVLNTTFDQDSPNQWFHHYRMTSAHDEKKTWDDIQCVLIELPKFNPNTLTEKKLAFLWLRFLKEINDRTTIVDPSLLEVKEIKQAVDLLEESAYSKTELLAYDKYWDDIRCEKALFKDYLKKGLAQGEVKGFAKGKAEGLAEGEMKAKAEMIRNFKQLGLSNEQIATASQFSLEQIKEILKQ